MIRVAAAVALALPLILGAGCGRKGAPMVPKPAGETQPVPQEKVESKTGK